jgi:hypothetical protein
MSRKQDQLLNIKSQLELHDVLLFPNCKGRWKVANNPLSRTSCDLHIKNIFTKFMIILQVPSHGSDPCFHAMWIEKQTKRHVFPNDKNKNANGPMKTSEIFGT